jgi:hypothetical protein
MANEPEKDLEDVQPDPAEIEEEKDPEVDPEPSEDEDEIDYKLLYEEAEAAKAKAESKVVDLKRELKDKPPVIDPEEEPEPEVDNLDILRKELAESYLDDAISALTDNEDEKRLILFHYENSIKSSGVSKSAISSDIRRAYLLANEKKIARTNAEMARALQSKASTSSNGFGKNLSHPKPDTKKFPLSKEDKRFLIGRGIDPETYQPK